MHYSYENHYLKIIYNKYYRCIFRVDINLHFINHYICSFVLNICHIISLVHYYVTVKFFLKHIPV